MNVFCRRREFAQHLKRVGSVPFNELAGDPLDRLAIGVVRHIEHNGDEILRPTSLARYKALRHYRGAGDPGRIRTSDILLPKQALYQAEPRPGPAAPRF